MDKISYSTVQLSESFKSTSLFILAEWFFFFYF